MIKTYLNIQKKYIPHILLIFIIMMLSGICIRKNIYNENYNKIKDKVAVIDKDNSDLSRLAKKILSNKNDIIEFKDETDLYRMLQNGEIKSVYIMQKDLQKEFFESAKKDEKVVKKVIEHYGVAREKTAGISVGELYQFFNFEVNDLKEYKKKYSDDEKGQKEFLKNMEERMNSIHDIDNNVNLEFIDFKNSKIKFNENIFHIILSAVLLLVVIYYSSKARVEILNIKEIKNKKNVLKNILPADILFLSVYTLFSVMIVWLSNINALNFKDMLILLVIYIMIAASFYLLTFLFIKTDKKEKAKKVDKKIEKNKNKGKLWKKILKKNSK